MNTQDRCAGLPLGQYVFPIYPQYMTAIVDGLARRIPSKYLGVSKKESERCTVWLWSIVWNRPYYMSWYRLFESDHWCRSTNAGVLTKHQAPYGLWRGCHPKRLYSEPSPIDDGDFIERKIQSWHGDEGEVSLLVYEGKREVHYAVRHDGTSMFRVFLTYRQLEFLPEEAWITQKRHLVEKKAQIIAAEMNRALTHLCDRDFLCRNEDWRGQDAAREWVRLRRAASDTCAQQSFFDEVVRKSGHQVNEDTSIMWRAWREAWLACALTGIMFAYEHMRPRRWLYYHRIEPKFDGRGT